MDDVKVYKLPNTELEFNFLYNEEIKNDIIEEK